MGVTPDPKPEKRIVNLAALRTARLAFTECAACGSRPGSIHHVIPRGEGGDDVTGNLLALCGSGTTGCHGAHHGNPYMATIASGTARIGIAGQPVPETPASLFERRDAEWVNRRIGVHIGVHRPDVVGYVKAKLGSDAAGADYLARHYYLSGV